VLKLSASSNNSGEGNCRISEALYGAYCTREPEIHGLMCSLLFHRFHWVKSLFDADTNMLLQFTWNNFQS